MKKSVSTKAQLLSSLKRETAKRKQAEKALAEKAPELVTVFEALDQLIIAHGRYASRTVAPPVRPLGLRGCTA